MPASAKWYARDSDAEVPNANIDLVEPPKRAKASTLELHRRTSVNRSMRVCSLLLVSINVVVRVSSLFSPRPKLPCTNVDRAWLLLNKPYKRANAHHERLDSSKFATVMWFFLYKITLRLTIYTDMIHMLQNFFGETD